jgi:hypothetical protein
MKKLARARFENLRVKSFNSFFDLDCKVDNSFAREAECERSWDFGDDLFIVRETVKSPVKRIGGCDWYPETIYILYVWVYDGGSYWEPPSSDWCSLHESNSFDEILHLAVMERNKIRKSHYDIEQQC